MPSSVPNGVLCWQWDSDLSCSWVWLLPLALCGHGDGDRGCLKPPWASAGVGGGSRWRGKKANFASRQTQILIPSPPLGTCIIYVCGQEANLPISSGKKSWQCSFHAYCYKSKEKLSLSSAWCPTLCAMLPPSPFLMPIKGQPVFCAENPIDRSKLSPQKPGSEGLHVYSNSLLCSFPTAVELEITSLITSRNLKQVQFFKNFLFYIGV